MLAHAEQDNIDLQTAAANHAHDTHTSHSRVHMPSLLSSLKTAAAARKPGRPEKPQDRWANYSTAKQLGFDDEETQKSAYEIEQEIKGRAGDVGAWETVEDSPPVYEPTPYLEMGDDEAGPSKRKLGEYGVQEDEEHEEFRFEGRKRPVRDPYAEDEAPIQLGLRVRVKEEPSGLDSREGPVVTINGQGSAPSQADVKTDPDEKPSVGWTRSKPIGKVDGPHPNVGRGPIKSEDGDGKVNVKREPSDLGAGATDEVEVKTESAAESLFKKRRPPPSSRKK